MSIIDARIERKNGSKATQEGVNAAFPRVDGESKKEIILSPVNVSKSVYARIYMNLARA